MEATKRKVLDVRKMSLDEWLALLDSPDRKNMLFVDCMFPTNDMRDEYLDTIHNRTDEEVINLLRNFLIPTGTLGSDKHSFEYLMHCMEHDEATFKKLMRLEFCKRLLKDYLGPYTRAAIWEGNTWIIDLLPDHPKLALESLHAYLIAHIGHIPDGRWTGLTDAEALIRAKFIEVAHPSSLLFSLDPYQFEHLIDALYTKMGYKTTLTSRTHDKGRDIIATKKEVGGKEKLLIQCKRTKKSVGVKEARALLGIVSNEKATKGILISTSKYSPHAKKFAKENSRVELIDQKDLQLLLNKFFGSKWPSHIDIIISINMKSKYKTY